VDRVKDNVSRRLSSELTQSSNSLKLLQQRLKNDSSALVKLSNDLRSTREDVLSLLTTEIKKDEPTGMVSVTLASVFSLSLSLAGGA
jgi:hypothetical protein